MKIIVGLGNPGKEYEGTRHNVGFEIAKDIIKKYNGETRQKFKGICSEIKIGTEKVIVLMPQTYMNLSGNSVSEVINFYKSDSTKDLIVIYDDMDMPLGKLRIRLKGSAGGHNGIKSIISHCGDSFMRIKCGIGKPNSREEVLNYVLNKFGKVDEKEVREMYERALTAAEELVKAENIDNVMAKFN